MSFHQPRPEAVVAGGVMGLKGWCQVKSIDQLIFVGFNGYAVALDRDTGRIVWSNNELQSGYVSLMLDGDRLIVSTNGYIFCLDPLTGETLWNNPMKGYGVGATSLASVRGQSSHAVLNHAEAADDSRRSHLHHRGHAAGNG